MEDFRPGSPFNPYAPPQYGMPPFAGPAKPTFFFDEEPRLRTVWRLSIFIVGFIVAQIAVSIAILAVIVAWYAISDGQVTQERLSELTQIDQSGIFALSAIPMTLASLLLVFVCRRWLDRRSLSSLGFVRPSGRWNSNSLFAFALGAAPIGVGFAIVAALGGYRVTGFEFSPNALFLTPALVIAAFHEEIVFRGYLLQNMIDVKRPIAGVLVSSLLFWLVHSLNPAAWSSPLVGLNLFGAGILLSLAYLLSRNIWFPSIMHFAWNFTQGIVLDIPISGIPAPGVIQIEQSRTAPSWITGGEFGLEASAVTAGLQVLMALFLFALVKSEIRGQKSEVRDQKSDTRSDEAPLNAELVEPPQAPAEFRPPTSDF